MVWGTGEHQTVDEDNGFFVSIIAEEQYSLWPDFADVQAG
jgi:uncharacterized protein YbdZ (MbtH family)